MGIRKSTPDVYYYNREISESKTVDYGDYFRHISTNDTGLWSDELYDCVTYIREGECIYYYLS